MGLLTAAEADRSALEAAEVKSVTRVVQLFEIITEPRYLTTLRLGRPRPAGGSGGSSGVSTSSNTMPWPFSRA